MLSDDLNKARRSLVWENFVPFDDIMMVAARFRRIYDYLDPYDRDWEVAREFVGLANETIGFDDNYRMSGGPQELEKVAYELWEARTGNNPKWENALNEYRGAFGDGLDDFLVYVLSAAQFILPNTLNVYVRGFTHTPKLCASGIHFQKV